MMRILQIVFLWLAGLGFLGHSFIPHHHHNNHNEVCAHETNHNHSSEKSCSHDHYNTNNEIFSVLSCCPDHDANNEHVCSFNVKLLVEKSHTKYAATTIHLFQLKQAQGLRIVYYNYNIKQAKKNFYGFRSNRAPPELA